MTGEFRKDLEPAVIRAEAAVLSIVREFVPAARLERIGPIEFKTGPSWSCWVITPTDEQRDRLANDGQLIHRLKVAAAAVAFAPNELVFQSQETVDRDYKGSWFYAMR